MSKATVGLFENSSLAGQIVRDLEAGGFPWKDIRVLSEPREIAGKGMMSTPHTDFEAELVRELRAIGAAELDAKAYVEGVRRGGIIVFATGSGEKLNTAAEIMNRHHAVELAELDVSETHLSSAHSGAMTPRRKGSEQTGRIRSSGGGARLFVW